MAIQPLSYLRSWRAARNMPVDLLQAVSQGETTWSPRSASSLKVNVDAGMRHNGATMGFVIRDFASHFVFAGQGFRAGMYQPVVAECMKVRQVLLWLLQQRKTDTIILEMDSLQVYRAIRSRNVRLDEFGSLIEDCIYLVGQLPNLSLAWV